MASSSIIQTLLNGIQYPISLTSSIYQHVIHLFSEKPLSKFESKVILITGANSGLGEALAHLCFQLGAQVILSGRKPVELQRVKDELLSYKPEVCHHEPIILVMDLTEINEIQPKISKLLELCGHIDVLINNAGVGYRGDVDETSIETDIRLMVTNYFGQVALTKAILPHMKNQNSGQIVVVSSVQGRLSIPFRSSYSASKHALQAFFDCLRSEVACYGIKVCVVSPGYIHTNFSIHAVTGSGQNYGKMDATTASGMSPKEVALKILNAAINDKDELILAPMSNKIAILLRAIFPSVLFYLMTKRAKRQKISLSAENQTVKT